jgi:DNA adenine methylase
MVVNKDTEEDIYNRQLKQIDIIRKRLLKYPFIAILHVKDYNILIGNTTENASSQVTPSDCKIQKNIFVSESNNSIYSDSEPKSDFDIEIPDRKESLNTGLSKNNIFKNMDIKNIPEFIPSINVTEKIIPKNTSISPEQTIINDTPKLNKEKNTESKKLLNKIINDYYSYHDKVLPNSNINFENINENTKNINTSKIKIIIEFYKLFEKYKDEKIKESSNSFIEYVNINEEDISVKYFSNLYEKAKKCHNFICYFKEMQIPEDKIIQLLYKGNITYDKLYRIRGSYYEELKNFFKNKIYLNNINEIPNLSKNGNINIKRTISREIPLSYVGNKYDYINIIENHIHINKNTKLYDLFSGSMSIPYLLNKMFPNNKIITNDKNKFLINFYNVLKNSNKELINKINYFNTIDNINNHKNLLKIINDINSNDIEKAAIYYILNKIAYNGEIVFKDDKLFIYNYKKQVIKIEENKFNNFSKFLNNININNICLLENPDYWLNIINKGDIVILDPPYDILNNENKHYLYNFDREEQEKLCIFINKLINKNVKVITFNGNTLFIKDLYKNFNFKLIESKTSLNKQKPYKELLIYN